MGNIFRDKVPTPKDLCHMGMSMLFEETVPKPHGRFILHMVDSVTGEVLEHWEKDDDLAQGIKG